MTPIQRGWVRLLDSTRARRIISTPPVNQLRSSALATRADMARRRVIARLEAGRLDMGSLVSCVVFIGHTKSGGSLLGACLDAHPDATIADELGLTRLIDGGFGRSELVAAMVRNSRREAVKGRVTARRIDAYSLAIPGGWQGRHQRLAVVGDSRAGPTTRRLGDDPSMLDRLDQIFHPTPVRYIHVVRHPKGPVSAMYARSGRSPGDGIADYAEQAERLERIRQKLGSDRFVTVRYEDMLARPVETVSHVARFAGLAPSEEFLDGCRRLVSPANGPGEAPWSHEDIEAMERLTAEHEWINPT